MHKNAHRRAHGCLWVTDPEREENRRVALSLSGVLEVKYNLDRYVKTDKNSKNCMHWNVAPDAL